LPIYRGDAENIIGVIHVKDLLRAMSRNNGDIKAVNVNTLAAKPWFVPDTTLLADQLRAFLQRRTHFALVVDEYGALQGLITLEDILEEIVGEIRDEHDLPVSGVRPQPDGTTNVDGWVTIRELNRAMNWNLPDEDATTIAGLVINEAQTIPDVGQQFSFYGFKFEILRRQRNQITAVRITSPKQKVES
jgi:Mg2+/Co2+ transporter CorB